MTDLKDQINILMERGIQPVSAQEVARRQPAGPATFPAKRTRRWRPAPWLTAATAGAAAVACAVALAASQAGGTGKPAAVRPHAAAPDLLTAAFVQHLASASRLALAHSGQAVIRSRQTLAGTLQQSSTDRITFDGANWNDSFSERIPTGSGTATTTQSAINRVVNGQAYDYFVAADGLAWYHDTGPNAVNSMHIPDPRKLLNELAPGAGFRKAGETTIGGVRVEHLTATVLSGLPAIRLPNLWGQGTLSALDVWIDSGGVVRQMSMSFRQTLYPGTMSLSELKKLPKGTKVTGWQYVEQSPVKRAKAVLHATAKGKGKQITVDLEPGSVPPKTQLTTITVNFLSIGQHQQIRVPAHAIPAYGVG